MLEPNQLLHLAIPKGRMQAGVVRLLADAGISLRETTRGYRPAVSLPDVEVKIQKPQNILEMLALNTRDLGFAGADWVAELGVDVVELLDTGLDPVRLVAAAPQALLVAGRLPARRLIVASEYERLAQQWIEREQLDATVLRSYGATEVFPPEDADLIVDNSATGETLRANDLVVVAEVLRSSTRLYASRRCIEDPAKRARADSLVLLLRSVLEARKRVMLEVNVTRATLEAVVAALPCMREPTIASLHGEAGFAVKAAVPSADLAGLIPRIKACGGTDIVVTPLIHITP